MCSTTEPTLVCSYLPEYIQDSYDHVPEHFFPENTNILFGGGKVFWMNMRFWSTSGATILDRKNAAIRLWV